MPELTKTVEQYMHTETVYRDAEGTEVYREEGSDVSWYDTLSGPTPVTADEMRLLPVGDE